MTEQEILEQNKRFGMEYAQRLARHHRQATTGNIEVELVFGRGGLWGQGITIFQFDSYGPSRSGYCTYSAVFMPGDEAAPSENRVGHGYKLGPDNVVLEMEKWFRLEIVVGHHEGATTMTMKELHDYLIDWQNQKNGVDDWTNGLKQTVEAMYRLITLMCSEKSDEIEIGKVITISTGITFTPKE